MRSQAITRAMGAARRLAERWASWRYALAQQRLLGTMPESWIRRQTKHGVDETDGVASQWPWRIKS